MSFVGALAAAATSTPVSNAPLQAPSPEAGGDVSIEGANQALPPGRARPLEATPDNDAADTTRPGHPPIGRTPAARRAAERPSATAAAPDVLHEGGRAPGPSPTILPPEGAAAPGPSGELPERGPGSLRATPSRVEPGPPVPTTGSQPTSAAPPTAAASAASADDGRASPVTSAMEDRRRRVEADAPPEAEATVAPTAPSGEVPLAMGPLAALVAAAGRVEPPADGPAGPSGPAGPEGPDRASPSPDGLERSRDHTDVASRPALVATDPARPTMTIGAIEVVVIAPSPTGSNAPSPTSSASSSDAARLHLRRF